MTGTSSLGNARVEVWTDLTFKLVDMVKFTGQPLVRTGSHSLKRGSSTQTPYFVTISAYVIYI